MCRLFQGLNSNPVPISLYGALAVHDLSNQVIESNTSFIIHPSSLYVGCRAPKPYGEVDKPFKLDVLTCGVDGKLIAGQKVTITASAESWAYVVDNKTKQGSYQHIQESKNYEMVTEKKDEKTESSLSHTVWSFTPKLGGSYT
jgi:uncharacterized protein YfaS (alpha-2-macroglobulin family)